MRRPKSDIGGNVHEKTCDRVGADLIQCHFIWIDVDYRSDLFHCYYSTRVWLGPALRCVRDGVSEDRNGSVGLFDTLGCGGDWIHRLFVLSEKEIINDACTTQPKQSPNGGCFVFYIGFALLIAIGVVANTKVGL